MIKRVVKLSDAETRMLVLALSLLRKEASGDALKGIDLVVDKLAAAPVEVT